MISILGNNQEIAFKMTTAEKPFALIRIGDISKWMKDTLSGYQITEGYNDDSVFGSLNDKNSDINILMGSRTFYEGWDSNRPNIILFVNIGVGKDSKKFVLQSVGRGVRIEPEKGKRERLINLFNAGKIDKNIFDQLKSHAHAFESLFVFGTNAENLQQIIKSLEGEGIGDVFELGDEFIMNPNAKNKLLLIPTYKLSKSDDFIKEIKYPISEDDLTATKQLFDKVGDKIFIAKYGCDLDVLKKTKDELKSMDHYEENRSINNPELLAERLFDFFNMKQEEFYKFNKVNDEDIVHFKKIQFKGDAEDYKALKEKIIIMKDFPRKEKELDSKYGKVSKKEYEKQYSLFDEAKKYKDVSIKYLANHYYHPLLVSADEKIDYLNHIVRIDSEVKFIEYLENSKNDFDKLDWWMFSKLDESLDKIYIPYYNGAQNKLARFKPDFIFWMQKKDKYSIIFIDPKGTSHAEYEHKADGYTKIYGKPSEETTFNKDGTKIKVYLRFFTNDKSVVAKGYKNYWIDNAGSISKLI